jgi:hypothetical protein
MRAIIPNSQFKRKAARIINFCDPLAAIRLILKTAKTIYD